MKTFTLLRDMAATGEVIHMKRFLVAIVATFALLAAPAASAQPTYTFCGPDPLVACVVSAGDATVDAAEETADDACGEDNQGPIPCT